MRRKAPANKRGGGVGCLALLASIAGGLVLAYFAYRATKADWVIPVVVLAAIFVGSYIGARLNYALMKRANQAQHGPHGQQPHKSSKRHR